MYTIDLSGQWRYEQDIENTGINERIFERKLAHENFTLPGDACKNKIGQKYTPSQELCYEAVRALRPSYEYIGALWLQREFTIPDDLEDKYITLFLERINIASDLWIDGKKVDRQIIEITTPHTYNLTGKIKSGTHTLTLRIDNSNLLNIDGMASGYSVDTQSIWNGIIGKIELRFEEVFHMSNIQVFSEKKSIHIKLTAHSDCLKPRDRRNACFEICVITPDGAVQRSKKYQTVLYNKKQILHFDYPIKNPQYWDEFNPCLYNLHIKMVCEKCEDIKSVSFGMRNITTDGHDFILNGRKIALRGTLDCGIYPLTGYPPTDLESWLKVCRTVKEYGLNHIRFHAWCPPDAAFTAADMTGIYVLAEMPLWLNVDVCALSTGDDPIHREYYLKEAMNISEYYGNHPSFVMFSNGNELLGDFEMLENITTQIKALDNRRLYTLTSNFDRPSTPVDDYISAFEVNGNRVRVQVFHDVVSEHTRLSYDKAVKNADMPIVSFEVGQYCVYPDVDSISDYTGNLVPANFEFIKNEMIKHNVYHMLDTYKTASGNFAALMYKEEIEASLRTHHMGGFELLGLCDYTGQGTATVGLLDVFYNSKGIISADKFRNFCSSVVPLMKADRIFLNTDKFKADFDLYDYGEIKIKSLVFKFSLYDGEKQVYHYEGRKKSISFSLGFVKKPVVLKAVLSVNEYQNVWNIFVYTNDSTECFVPIFTKRSAEFEEILKNGGKAVMMMNSDNLKQPVEGLFKPAFWSPAHFPSERACGIICRSEHPIFNDFPTGDYADFQWKHPVDNSTGADVSMLPKDFEYIIEPIPNFYSNLRRSPLFEAKVGNADILFCGFNLYADKIAVTALRNSIFKYVSSDEFRPVQTLSYEELNQILK